MLPSSNSVVSGFNGLVVTEIDQLDCDDEAGARERPPPSFFPLVRVLIVEEVPNNDDDSSLLEETLPSSASCAHYCTRP
jgi:hypothetical protein